MDYYKLKDAVRLTGLCTMTIHRYARENKIKSIVLPTGRKRYDISTLIPEEQPEKKETERRKVCYCRVSTYSQTSNLDNQVNYMIKKYPDYEIITDIGSGINFKRKGIKKLIEYAIANELDTLVIAFKDRLCRIGYDLLEHIFTTYSNTTILVDSSDETETVNEEMSKDIIEIITVYSAKIHGMRNYKKSKLDL
tara:strand:+ start:23038 stop:23619 length:582 start_codon:yes stop_codon:yes gene_type:complete